MGTSTSSSGPGAGVSLDPPWLDAPADGDAEDGTPQVDSDNAQTPDAAGNETAGTEEVATEPASTVPAVAPPRRFSSARRALGSFSRTGDTSKLGRALGHYAKTGMGGAGKAASRMRATTQAGAGLFSLLQQARDGTSESVTQWVESLLATNPEPADIADAVLQTMALGDGSADDEALKDSMAQAFSELLATQPDVDLVRMGNEDLWTLMQYFLGNAVCSRISFDMGQFFESARLNPSVAVQRELEMREFVKNEVGVQLGKLRTTTSNPTRRQLDKILSDALRLTFEVYEGMV